MAHDPRVYVKFDGTNWTDVTPYVREYEITRGRSYELDDFEAATLTVTFDNEDGRFTPRKTSSPYYPNVKPKREIKVVNEGATPDVIEFYGSVERWPVIAGLGIATVTINATDPLAPVAQIEAKRPVAELIMASEPRRYYPFSDGANSPIAGDWGADGVPAQILHSKYGGAATFGGPSLLTRGEGTNGGSFQDTSTFATSGSSVYVPINEAIGDRLSVYMFVQFPTNLSRNIWLEYNADGEKIRQLQVTGTGVVEFYHLNTTGTTSYSFTSAIIQPNKTYLIHAWTAAAGSNQFGVDVYDADSASGVRLGGFAINGTSRDWTSVTTEAYIGPKPYLTYEVGDTYYEKKVSNLVVDWGKTTTGNGSLLYTWLHDALRAQPLTDNQFFAVLARALTGAESTNVIGGFVDTELYYPNWDDGINGRELLRQFEESTGGVVYAPNYLSGSLAYFTRHYRIGQPAAISFSESTAAIDGDLLFEVDEARIVNDTTATRVAGGEFKSIDSASVADYGRHTLALTLDIVDQYEAQAAAEWRTYLGSDPLVRCDEVSVNVAAQPAYGDAISALDIGDKITLADLPTAAPYATADFFIEGITKRVVVDGGTPEHEVTFQLSPADRLNGWVLEDSSFGLLGTTTIALY